MAAGGGRRKIGSEVIGGNVGRAVVDKGFVVDEDDVLGRMIAVDGEGDNKAGILDFGYLFIEQHVLVVLAIEVDKGDKNYDDENTLDDSRDNGGC